MKQAQYKRLNAEPSKVNVKMHISCMYLGIMITFKGDVSPIRDPATHHFVNDIFYDLERGLPTLN